MLEALGAAVVGVGDLGRFVLAAEVGEQPDFFAVVLFEVEVADVGEVLAVGAEDQVEAFEVGGLDLPRATGDRVAAAAQGFRHAWIGRIAGVEADGAGGIDLELGEAACVGDELAEDDLGGGGAADVSHADEQDAGGHGGREGHAAADVDGKNAGRGAELCFVRRVPAVSRHMKTSAMIGGAAALAGVAVGFLVGSGTGGDGAAGAGKQEVSAGARIAREGATLAEQQQRRVRSFEEAMDEPGQMARLKSLVDLYAGMGPDELAAEADKLDGMPMADRILASMMLFSRWGEVDPLGALEYSKTMGFGGMFARPTVLRSWASLDPVNAAKYFEEHPGEFEGMGPGRGGDDGAELVAREWAKLDADKALEWADSLEGRQRSEAMISVLGELAAKDPAQAAAMAAQLDEGDRARAFSEIAEQWALKDFGAAEAWANTLSGEAREEAMSSAVAALAKSDPVLAADKALAMAAGDARQDAIGDVAGDWSRISPAEAATFFVENGSPADERAIREIIGNWVGKDASAAQGFIQSQPAGPLRDEAAQVFVWSNRSGSAAESVALAETITDERTRDRTIGIGVSRWMQQDEPAARAYVEQSELLSASAKERLLSGQGGGRWGRGR